MQTSLLSSFLPAIFLAAAPALVAEPLETRQSLVTSSAWAGSSVNTIANLQSTLFTHGSRQFGLFYDETGRLTLARRNVNSEGWETRPTDYYGNVSDAHNSAVLAVDGEGVLHVAWDHHDNPLNYARSVAPGRLKLGERQSMTGQAESRVTYPAFLAQPDGDLLFLYRNGESGRGDLVLNRYRVSTRAWSQIHPNLIDGQGERSAYVSASVGAKGWLHLAWNWRETPDVATNHDLCYAVSKDGGATWQSASGESLTLPLTVDSPVYAARIPMNSRMMNPPSVAADARGRPLIANYWAPEGSEVPQYHVVRFQDGKWTTSQVTQRTEPFELSGYNTKRPPISRAALVAGDPGVVLVFRDDSAGKNAVAYWDRTGDLAQWKTFPLTETGLGAWEPSIDPQQWALYEEIHLLVQEVEQVDGRDDVEQEGQASPIHALEVILGD